jgi:ADP-heptose:LPS heptosyltransferase
MAVPPEDLSDKRELRPDVAQGEDAGRQGIPNQEIAPSTAAEEVRRVLVLRPGAIGDTLVTLPALLAVRQRYPRARIEMAGNATALPIAQASGLIDAWIRFDDGRVTRLFMPADPPAGDHFLGIDVAIAWGRDADGTLRRAFERRGAREIVVAPSRPDPSQPELVAAHLLGTLAPLGIATEPQTLSLPELRVPDEAEDAALAELTASGLAERPFIAIHPSSGSPAKNWPAEQFLMLVDLLAERHGLPCVVFGGPADAEALLVLHDRTSAGQSDAVRSDESRPGPERPVLIDRPLLVVAALLRRAAGFVGNDSGLSHLAGMLGVPTLALFGPSDPTLWAPLGPRVRVVRTASLATLPAHVVLAELEALLKFRT